MQKIYIDVTNLVGVTFLTGIQRVVKNISLELYEKVPDRMSFLSYDEQKRRFNELDSVKFINFLDNIGSVCEDIFTGELIGPKDMAPGDIFFDIDAVWNNTYKRSVLLPDLKQFGVRTCVFIHDIIPVTHPQFSHANTRFNFMNYLGAYLQYGDAILVSAKSTLDVIYELADKLGLEHIPGFVSGLGSDFNGVSRKIDEKQIPEEVRKAASGKYVLSVGTIEPRKNHSLLIDAFEKELFDEDVKLIFAGKIGWNVSELSKRIEEHPQNGEKFFHFIGLSDEVIDYLYAHAFLVAFPSFIEGYGLPIVESLQRGTPVIASDVPVLREVGRDHCEYFELDSCDAFCNVVKKYLNDMDEYEKLRKKASEFETYSWKQTAEKMLAAIDTLKAEERKAKRDVHQMVILTARVDDIAGTIPFIEEYMPFIDKLLLCCPDKVSEEMASIKTKRIKIETLTDEELLHGEQLPEDHGTRNFFLRCLAVQNDKVDDAFIMSDDDYRPLRKVTLDTFVNGDSYRAYYCNELNNWLGVVGNITSYDRYIFRTRDFVNENKYPGYQYSSHMPQIIDKELYVEMIKNHPGIEKMGLDEWSSYFNYAQYRYPDLIKSEPYLTMCWPGRVSDWSMHVKPAEYVFENFYDFLYDRGEIFEGKSKAFSDDQLEENKEKIILAEEEAKSFFEGKGCYEEYCGKIIKESMEIPSFGIYCKEGGIEIGAPLMLELKLGATTFLPFVFKGDKEGLTLQLAICNGKNTLAQRPYVNLDVENLSLTDGKFVTSIVCSKDELKKGNYILEVRVEDKDITYVKRVALKLI